MKQCRRRTRSAGGATGTTRRRNGVDERRWGPSLGVGTEDLPIDIGSAHVSAASDSCLRWSTLCSKCRGEVAVRRGARERLGLDCPPTQRSQLGSTRKGCERSATAGGESARGFGGSDRGVIWRGGGLMVVRCRTSKEMNVGDEGTQGKSFAENAVQICLL
jgi:hypothetical protein